MVLRLMLHMRQCIFDASSVKFDQILWWKSLLFWFFSDFRCGVPLFIVILFMYKYKNR